MRNPLAQALFSGNDVSVCYSKEFSWKKKTLAGEKIGAKHSGDHKPREPQTPQKPPASGKTYAPRLGSTKAI
jgi:hypothetical protein